MKSFGEMEVERLMEEGHVVVKMELNYFDLFWAVSNEAQKVMDRLNTAGKKQQMMNHIVDWWMTPGDVAFYDLPTIEELDYYIANEMEEDMRREEK